MSPSTLRAVLRVFGATKIAAGPNYLVIPSFENYIFYGGLDDIDYLSRITRMTRPDYRTRQHVCLQ